ncbi:hypothetical protein RND81_05G217600 [Saponaria officinalis]|uniref:glutathione transferase n=1 Tax=Saponaria officinalis TaxID=3572 RepID=A0AAW1L2Y1_SAPOF
MSEVRLLGSWRSGYCHRITWALKLKGIKYEYCEEDLDNKSDDLLGYNPIFKRVPVLIHNGRPIIESVNIVEYIDEIWPHSPLFPIDPYDRAMARFWVKFVEDQSQVFYKYFRAIDEELEKQAKEAKQVLKTLEDQVLLEDMKFFGGEEIGYIDISLGWIAFGLNLMQEVVGIEILNSDTFPRLHAWSNKFNEHPVIKDNSPDQNMMLAYFKELRARFINAPTAISS